MVNRVNATIEDVSRWLNAGIFVVTESKVFKIGGRELSQRVNNRRGMEDGDPRVDLQHEKKRRSCHVSQLVWMQETRQPIPSGFEIHHFDENPHNNSFSNLICVHKLDHLKFHSAGEVGLDPEIPF